jgi:hypothetical protein
MALKRGIPVDGKAMMKEYLKTSKMTRAIEFGETLSYFASIACFFRKSFQD